MIIALEGLDKSGKHTAREYLKSKLEEKSYKVGVLEFPNYESFFGKLIRQWLRKEIDFDKSTFELLMYSDKAYLQEKIEELEFENDFLIIDRYVLSQLAYGSGEVSEEWLKTLISNLILPDLTIYFDVDVDTSLKRKGQHGENDKYEEDTNFLFKVKNNYNKYLLELDNFIKVNANNSLEEVQNELDKIIIDIIVNYKPKVDVEYERI